MNQVFRSLFRSENLIKTCYIKSCQTFAITRENRLCAFSR